LIINQHSPEAIYRCLDLMREELERQRKENEQRWADLHKYLANSRNAAIMDLGGIETFLGYPCSIVPRRERVQE